MLIEENTEVYLYDKEVGNNSLNKIYKIEVIKKNLKYLELHDQGKTEYQNCEM